MSSSFKTSFCWEIYNLRSKYYETIGDDDNKVRSDKFAPITCPSVFFRLCIVGFYHGELTEDFCGIEAIDFDDIKSIEISFKIWFKCGKETRFCERSVDNIVLDQKRKSHYFPGPIDEESDKPNLFKTIYSEENGFSMCCEITVWHTVKICPLEFHLNQWKLFEEQIHDFTFFVGKKEFKVLKSFFMAQSPVFKAMFNSNLKEATENKVEINDMSEETLFALIKWMYVSQIEKGVSVEELFKVANKYQIDLLKSECVSQMASTLNAKNVFSRLSIATFYNQDQLKLQILAYLKKLSHQELAECMLSEEWHTAKDLSKLVLDNLK